MVNVQAIDPSRCAACSGKYHCIPADGPGDADIWLILERPGQWEEANAKQGYRRYGGLKNAIGPTGDELNDHYLGLAGLRRSDLRVMNTVRCLTGQSRVMFADGTTERIAAIVSNKISKDIVSVDSDGNLTTGKILDWHRSSLDGRKLYRVRYARYTPRSGYVGGGKLTGDHEILTNLGWMSVLEASRISGLKICTDSPGLSKKQLSAVLGMVIGDGGIGSSRALTVMNGAAQLEYSNYKRQLVSNTGLTNFDKVGFQTKRRPVYEYIASNVDHYTSNPSFIEDNFNLPSLAIWYMDDGHAKRRGGGRSERSEICATRRTDLELFVDLIQRRFGLEAAVNKGRIEFNTKNTKLLSDLIGAWVPECLRYKLCAGAPKFDPSLYEPDNEPFYDDIVVEEVEPERPTVYCLTTSTGNFSVCGTGIVHNCGADHNRKPSEKEIRSCTHKFLQEELRRSHPKLLILAGATACALLPLFGGEGEKWLDLDTDHGIPRWGRLWDWEGFVVPHYHPALGLHSTGKMSELMEDWEKLGVWLKGNCEQFWPWGVDLHPNPQYRLAQTPQELDQYFLQHGQRDLGGVDTESDLGEPWSIQVSARPGTAVMIRTNDHRLRAPMRRWMSEFKEVALHNAEADLWIREWLRLPELNYRDTQQECYHLAMNQGLKDNGFRLFNVRMQDWKSLVTPYSMDRLKDYLVDALLLAESRQTRTPQFSEKTNKRLKNDLIEKLPEERPLRDLLRYINSSPTYDPWKRLKGEMTEEDIEAGEDWSRYEKLSVWLQKEQGRWPERSIAHVPINEAKDYGGRDADITLRLALELRRLRAKAEEGWAVQTYDHDR